MDLEKKKTMTYAVVKDDLLYSLLFLQHVQWKCQCQSAPRGTIDIVKDAWQYRL